LEETTYSFIFLKLALTAQSPTLLEPPEVGKNDGIKRVNHMNNALSWIECNGIYL